MTVIEKVEQSVVDGNSVETAYYDNGDIRTIEKDFQDHEILNKLVNDEGEMRESVERTYYDNGQQATEIKIDIYGDKETTRWREDGQEIFYQKTDKNNKILTERVYDFFENGNVKKCEHKRDNNIRESEEFYENGQLKRRQNGPDNAREKDGERYNIEEYSEKGQLLHSEGRKLTYGTDYYGDGLCSRYEQNIEYYDNGNVKSEMIRTGVESQRGRTQSWQLDKKTYYGTGALKSSY